jgi:hypothetical protein
MDKDPKKFLIGYRAPRKNNKTRGRKQNKSVGNKASVNKTVGADTDFLD